MVPRIRFLFQRVFQRPIGRSDAIPYHFGRGLLAERKGIPIDWAGYARKMTHRGTGDVAHLGVEAVSGSSLSKKGKAFVFESMEDLRERTTRRCGRKTKSGQRASARMLGETMTGKSMSSLRKETSPRSALDHVEDKLLQEQPCRESSLQPRRT